MDSFREKKGIKMKQSRLIKQKLFKSFREVNWT